MFWGDELWQPHKLHEYLFGFHEVRSLHFKYYDHRSRLYVVSIYRYIERGGAMNGTWN